MFFSGFLHEVLRIFSEGFKMFSECSQGILSYISSGWILVVTTDFWMLIRVLYIIAESVFIRWYYKGLVLARKGWVLSRYEVISGYIRPSGLLQRHFNTQSGPGCQDIIISWLIFLYYWAWLFLIVTFNHLIQYT